MFYIINKDINWCSHWCLNEEAFHIDLFTISYHTINIRFRIICPFLGIKLNGIIITHLYLQLVRPLSLNADWEDIERTRGANQYCRFSFMLFFLTQFFLDSIVDTIVLVNIVIIHSEVQTINVICSNRGNTTSTQLTASSEIPSLVRADFTILLLKVSGIQSFRCLQFHLLFKFLFLCDSRWIIEICAFRTRSHEGHCCNNKQSLS